MGTTRTDLRGFLQKTSADDERSSSSSYLINSAAPGGSPSRKKEEEELVKYMSKLPCYLQAGEDTLQTNVLNLGVLDWSHLEKWKHGRRARARASGPHICVETKVSLEPQLASSSLNKQEMPTCTYHSSARDHHDRVKSRRSLSHPEPASSTLLSGGSLRAKGNLVVRDKHTENKAGEEVLHAQEAIESGKQCVDKFDGEDKTIGGCSNHQVSNIVLLRSTKHSRSCTTLSNEPQMPLPSSLDDNTRVARDVNHSFHFSQGINSSLELRSQIPPSCPLSFDLERDSEDMMLLPLLHGAPKKESSGGTTRHSKTASRRIFDQDIRQVESRKKTDPSSPSNRFSFSFGRLSRSFTFREDDSSAGRPLTNSDDTIKSDSMRLDGSVSPSHSSNPEDEKQNTHGGSRVSPLRRLLDPLLKPKGSENVLLPSKPRSTSSNQDASRTIAILQLTIRDGIPLFQFVVDDDDNLNKKSRRSILGATMKSSDASSLVKEEDSVHYCTFYSVNEVKKKKKRGSWLINHGHKEKQQHRFVYNVIGEMRLCNSSSTEQKSEDITSVIRESVLVDETEEGVKEVAAVVIKKKPAEEVYGETTVIIPGGVHSIPEKGAPTPLIRRWRTGGCCDCGGWDVGCKLHLLSNKTFLHDLFDQTFKLFHQEESDKTNSVPVLAMTELKRGMYRVEFGSFLSNLQAFFVCVTVITCASEEETVSKTTVKSSSPFVPPLSPVGRA